MKTLKLVVLFIALISGIQSCSRESEVCVCLDMATKMMKGNRENNYDGTFPKKYMREHAEENKRCEELADGVTDESGEEKVLHEMEECPGYAAYTEELNQETEHLRRGN